MPRSEPGPRPVQAALIASLPAFVVLVLTPASVYISNQPYFDHRYVVILHLSLLHLLIMLGFYLVFRAMPGLRRPLGYPLGVVGAFLLGVSLFAPSPVGELLGGRIREVEESTASTLFNVGLLLGLWALARFVPAPRLINIASVFCVLSAALVPGVVALEASRADESVIDWARTARPVPGMVTNSPSVYHLIFDGFDATLFERIVDELELQSAFTGFVWYRNAFSNYTSTRLSFPSFMTGRVFDETITDGSGGRIGRTEGLVETLASNGYGVTQYNGHFVNNHTLTHVRHSTAVLEDRTYGRLRHLVQLLDLSVLLAAPTVLKTQTAINGRGLFSHWLLRTERSIADWSRNPPMLSLMLLDRMIADEAERPARGQYVNGHFLLPHRPSVLSADCEYQPERRVDSHVTLVAQSMCTITKFTEIVDALRRLGRFRDAMIIIHADHGTLRRERPLLLVKYPGRESEPFEIAPYVVQLADVAPTIHEALGLEHTGLDGVPLDDDAPGARREITVWVAKPSLR